MGFGLTSALGKVFLLVHDRFGQISDKTHECEADLDDPVKESCKLWQHLGWIVEEGLNGLGLIDDLCFCDQCSQHNKGDDHS